DMLSGIKSSVVVATPTEIEAAIARSFVAPTTNIVPIAANHSRESSRRRRPIAVVAAIAAAFLLFATGMWALLAPAAGGLQARAQLTIFQGNVEYHRSGGTFTAVNTGQLVRQGDTVRTGANGHAALTFFDDTVIVLEPATEIQVVALKAVNGTDIDATITQLSGKTWHVVTHQQTSQGKYVVQT